MGSPDHIPIINEVDVVTARASGRKMAIDIGFSTTDATVVATAISEVARNIIQHAGRGEIQLKAVHSNGKKGLLIIARDEGPGIKDLARAMQQGYSTTNSLGLGLPGARRLVDEFEIDSEVGKGTTITMRKWSR
jgi:serine/threonine-protein kinase RsbT